MNTLSNSTDNTPANELSWRDIAWQRFASLFFLGFSAGVPILLIFSTLSLWLGEAGVQKSAVTYFSWAALGYSFKFVWAPLVDKLPLPLLYRLGRRRSWLLFSQCAVIVAICWMASIDPAAGGLTTMAFAAVLLGFSSATQDICIDAYRIECAHKDEQALLSSCYIAGYRVGMIVAGAGALVFADMLGTSKDLYIYEAWRNTYWLMAAVMLVGIATTLLIGEPEKVKQNYANSTAEYVKFFVLFLLSIAALIAVFKYFPTVEFDLSGGLKKTAKFVIGTVQLFIAIAAGVAVAIVGAKLGVADQKMIDESYIEPVKNFFVRYGKLSLLILLLIGFYRVSDIVLGVISNVFYQDLGYTKTQMAGITKTFGLVMTIVGSFIGGFLSLKIGVMRVLLLGAVLSALTNLLFAWLATLSEPSLSALTWVIAADNLSAGIAVAAFVAWLSSLTSVSFTATQYAIFSSVMTLFPKLLGGYSGTIVEQIGYANFFTMTAIMGLPVIVLTLYLQKHYLKS